MCVVWSVGQAKGKTIRKNESGAAQMENNRKMECVCVVWSVGQPKGKTIRKMERVCSMECGAAQRENNRKMECVCV